MEVCGWGKRAGGEDVDMYGLMGECGDGWMGGWMGGWTCID